MSKAPDHSPSPELPAPIWLRMLLVVVGLAAWFYTQYLLGQRSFPKGIGDAVQEWTAPWNRYLLDHPRAADGLLIFSSALIDILGVFLLGASIIGRSMRPFLALLMLFIMRQVCQSLCALPAPPGMIWHNPGIRSLLVTYEVSTDFFFSGHTGMAVLGAVELWRMGGKTLGLLGIAIAVFEALAVIVLRAHYTMDVFAGTVAALLAAELAARIAPRCDRALARLAGR